jgi:predicted O-methyltransferase YrrM
MDQAVRDVLSEYESRAREEWAVMERLPSGEMLSRLDEFLLFIGPNTGKLLHLIATAAKSQVLLEIGTSYGYSTIWLADAARETGGRVHSLELSSKKVEHARSRLRAAGLEAYVEFHVGDALTTLAALPGPFDFVLLDLWKDLYVPCLELFHPKLAAGGFIAADNLIFPPNPTDQEAYRRAVRSKADLESLLLPVGSGIELSKKRETAGCSRSTVQVGA